MGGVVFDSSLYITALRSGEPAILARRCISAGSLVWLSAVVLEELYAGAGPQQNRIIGRLEDDFEAVNRLLVPNLSDWTQTGLLLAKLGAKYGYEQAGRARLTCDALIAMSAARMGLTVVTANLRDFGRLAEFRPFSWKSM